MVSIKDEYFSASTNRSLNAIAISGDILAFGSSNAVLLYNYKVSSQCEVHTHTRSATLSASF